MQENKENIKEKSKEAENKAKEKTEKSLNGTGKPSAWEKAAETIAGDNQLMASLLKLLLSPFTLLAGAGLIIYLFVKNSQIKKEVEKIKKESDELKSENKILSERAESFEKKYKKIKKVFELEQNEMQHNVLPQMVNGNTNFNSQNNKPSYLR